MKKEGIDDLHTVQKTGSVIEMPSGCKPEIDYPCRWQYKVICTDKAPVENMIIQTLTDVSYTLSDSKTSSTGKYTSMSLELTVESEEERLRLYTVLTSHAAVKVVL